MSDCHSCPLHPPRRRFLGRMSAALALVFSAGLSSEALAGRPASEVTGVAVGATEKRYPIPAVDGVTIDGAKVSAGGQNVPVDERGRFKATVAPRAGDDAVVVRLEHPRTGVHYYVRQAGSRRHGRLAHAR